MTRATEPVNHDCRMFIFILLNWFCCRKPEASWIFDIFFLMLCITVVQVVK